MMINEALRNPIFWVGFCLGTMFMAAIIGGLIIYLRRRDAAELKRQVDESFDRLVTEEDLELESFRAANARREKIFPVVERHVIFNRETGEPIVNQPCSKCNGSGIEFDAICPKCGGKGTR